MRALAKLEQVLPARLRQRVGALGRATEPLLTWGQPTADPSRLVALATAVTGRERLRFAYRRHDGTQGERLVDPHKLVSAGRRWYLVAYDLDRADWRVFRADRIGPPKPTGVRFAPRDLPAADAVAYVTASLTEFAPVYEAVATLHAPAERLADRIGDLTPIDAETCLLRGHSDTLEYLAWRLLSLGCDFEVHEPPELIAHLADLGARATRAAGRRPGSG